MNEQVQAALERCPQEVTDLFMRLRETLYESAPNVPEEKLWAGMPSYHCGDAFVRLIPFKDHINIEAKAVLTHREALAGYKITPKGMLQISLKQDVPFEALKTVFAETLK